MSVHTSTFGGVRLSGEDAKKFINQVKHGRPNKAAAGSLAEGNKMLKEYDKKGYATIAFKKA